MSADRLAISAVSRSRISPIRMMSGSWPDEGSECIGEAKPDLWFDLDLTDAGELVFDRVFDGQDVGVDLVQMQKRSIKGGGLAASR